MNAPLPLDDQLCFGLYAASMAITRTYKPMLDALGITYPQYLVLLALWEAEPQAIGALAERLSLESSTITPLVKRLEAAGLVRRTRDTGDERRVNAALTAEGVALRGKAARLGETIVERSGMSLAELGQLHRLSRRLLAGLSGTDAGRSLPGNDSMPGGERP